MIYLADLARPTFRTPGPELLDRYGGIRRKNEIVTMATVEGREAKVTFKLARGGLESIEVAWTETFADLGECEKEFARLRESVDGILGGGASDNVESFWERETVEATLVCDPNRSGQASLRLRAVDPPTRR